MLLWICLSRIAGHRHHNVHNVHDVGWAQTKHHNATSYKKVSIISASFGQSWCDRNVLENACYQHWPRERLELLVAETNVRQSPLFRRYAVEPIVDADGVASRTLGPYRRPRRVIPTAAFEGTVCGVAFRYFYFNATNFERRNKMRSVDSLARRPQIGAVRNFLVSKATGDVFVNQDNDDFYSSGFVRRVVRMGFDGMRPGVFVSVQETAIATVLANGSVSVALKKGATALARQILDANRARVPCRIGKKRFCNDATEYHVAIDRNVTERCEYSTKGMSEGQVLEKCIKDQRIPWVDLTMFDETDLLDVDFPVVVDDASRLRGGAYGLVKIKSGLSITSQVFLFRGDPKGHFQSIQSLDVRGWRAHLRGQADFYKRMHEMDRSGASLFNDEDDEALLPETISPLFAKLGSVPGFRRRPGKLIVAKEDADKASAAGLVIDDAHDADTCIDSCRSIADCHALEFRVQPAVRCRLFLSAHLPAGCQMAPWRIFHVETFEKEINGSMTTSHIC